MQFKQLSIAYQVNPILLHFTCRRGLIMNFRSCPIQIYEQYTIEMGKRVVEV